MVSTTGKQVADMLGGTDNGSKRGMVQATRGSIIKGLLALLVCVVGSWIAVALVTALYGSAAVVGWHWAQALAGWIGG